MRTERRKRGKRIRRLVLAIVGGSVFIALLSSPLIYYLHLATKHCQAAQAAMEVADWTRAQAELEGVAKLAIIYPKIHKLLCRSYYFSGVESLKAENWDKAQKELKKLISLEPNYRDSHKLFCQSYYRPGEEAFNTQRWGQARDDLEELYKLDRNYRDGKILLCESYYRPAIEAVNAGDLDKANLELSALLKIDSLFKDYKDVKEIYAMVNVSGKYKTTTYSNYYGPSSGRTFYCYQDGEDFWVEDKKRRPKSKGKIRNQSGYFVGIRSKHKRPIRFTVEGNGFIVYKISVGNFHTKTQCSRFEVFYPRKEKK